MRELSRVRRRLLELWVSRVRGCGSVAVVTLDGEVETKAAELSRIYGRRKNGEVQVEMELEFKGGGDGV